MSSPILEASYRSKLEVNIAEQLLKAGVDHLYENEKLSFIYPARKAKYLPDFVIPGTNIVLEAKGWFKAADRQKMLLAREHNPGLDFRMVFERANNKLYKASPTTYAKWCDDHEFKWADKGIIPKAWLDEIKEQQRNEHGNRSKHATKASHRPRASRKAPKHHAHGGLRSLRRTASR